MSDVDMQAEFSRMEAMLDGVRTRVAMLSSDIRDLSRATGRVEGRSEADEAEHSSLRRRIDQVGEELHERLAPMQQELWRVKAAAYTVVVLTSAATPWGESLTSKLMSAAMAAVGGH